MSQRANSLNYPHFHFQRGADGDAYWVRLFVDSNANVERKMPTASGETRVIMEWKHHARLKRVYFISFFPRGYTELKIKP